MKTHEITTYQFNELSEDAQKKALDNNREFDLDLFNDLCDIDYYKETILEKIGFEYADIQYSGFSCQGDGLSFESDIDIDKIFSYMVYQSDKWSDIKDYYYLINMMEKDLLEFSFWIKRQSSMYVHENTCSTDFDFDCYLENCPVKAEGLLYDIAESFCDEIEDIRHEVCQTIYYKFQSDYEYLMSDEYLSEIFIESEIEFLEDGTIY